MAALMFFAAQPSSAAPAAAFPKYIAVIDAGSSGTRLYFYRLAENGTIDMLISNFEFRDDEDGIDNFLCDDPSKNPQQNVLKVVINPLLTQLTIEANRQTPPVKKSEIEVNLLATAGMRSRQKDCEALYPGKGAELVASLYKTIRSGIGTQGFKKGEVRTSDGDREEGPWTWLNLNYVLKTLDTAPYGDVEMGGSSAQIVFPVDPAKNPVNAANHIVSVRYKGKDYTVFSKSYLGLGQDDARKFVRQSTAAPEKCWANGFSASNDGGESDARYKKLSKDGQFDYKICSDYYRQYLTTTIAEQGGGPQADRSLGDFVGLDGIWYGYEYFLTPPNDPISQLSSAIPQLCANSSNFPTIATKRQIQNQCPNGTYVTTLMFDPAGLFNGSKRLVTVARSNDRRVTIDGKNLIERELTWTRGYLLQKYFAN